MKIRVHGINEKSDDHILAGEAANEIRDSIRKIDEKIKDLTNKDKELQIKHQSLLDKLKNVTSGDTEKHKNVQNSINDNNIKAKKNDYAIQLLVIEKEYLMKKIQLVSRIESLNIQMEN
jgi:seryl-tRNA synthetase